MKIFYKVSKYDQFIDIENKRWNCTCNDFIFRQIQKDPVGKCKHINEIMKMLDEEIKCLLN